MTDLVFLSLKPEVPPDSYWDMCLLKTLLKDLKVHYDMGELKEAIVIIPGANQGDCTKEINTELAKLDKCKVIVTSDESNKFPAGELEHPNMVLFSQYPTDKYEAKWIPLGAPNNREIKPVDKDLNFFFSGQVTHKDRRDCVKALRTMEGKLVETSGFAKGLEPSKYYAYLDRAKIAPCPNGTVSPDSFRLYEALEAGCIPIVKDDPMWDKLFKDSPIIRVKAWSKLKSIEYTSEQAIECQAWWKRYKLDLKRELIGDSDTTIVVPTSPIKSNPSTNIIDETINSIHNQLAGEIIITFDGVRDSQKDLTEDYNLFIRRVISKHDIYPIVFSDHMHQVGMMREAIKHCSEYIVYVEHDTPFTNDHIDWQGCKQTLNELDLIRFHFEQSIPGEHKYLMLDKKPKQYGVPVIRTFQWSQRPHITTKEFYEKVLSNFSENANSFIEDKMHSVCQDDHDYKLAIYHPYGSIKRTYHTDGRADAPKWDNEQVF